MPAVPTPTTRGRCRTVPAGLGLGLSADGAAVCSGPGAQRGLGSVAGQGLTYPFCCGALSACRGAPKGRAVLLREALGAKVYRGGSAAGARAWAETEPGRARAGVGGDLGGSGAPPLERTAAAPAPPPHIWPKALWKGVTPVSRGPFGSDDLSRHGQGRTKSGRVSAQHRPVGRQADRQADMRVPRPCGSP